jgi:hypothetical protein
MSNPIKNQLLSASAKAMRVSQHYSDKLISYTDHMVKRATTNMFSKHKSSLLLHKILIKVSENVWKMLNFNQVNTRRQTNFYLRRTNNLMVDINVLTINYIN